MMLIAQIVNWSELGESVAAGAISAILFTTIVSIGIRGMAKFVDYGSEGRYLAAYASLAVGGIASILTITIIILGIALMVTA